MIPLTTSDNPSEAAYKAHYYPQMFVQSGAFFVAAAVANYFKSALTLPFFAIASTQLLTAGSIKIYERYNPASARELQLKGINFKQRHPWLQKITFLITIITAFIWPPLSCACGVLIGFYSGLLINSAYYKLLQSSYKAPQQPLNAQIAHC